MDYRKHYNILIDRAKNRNLESYGELHHILPRCLGGNDNKNNLVKLTAREHFVAHVLLIKIYPKEYGLINAVNMMTVSNGTQRNRNRMYGWLKERFSIEQSRQQSGEGNSQFGTIWISNILEKTSIRINKDENIPENFVKGRNIWKRERECKICNIVFYSNSLTCSTVCRKELKSINTKVMCSNPEIIKKLSESNRKSKKGKAIPNGQNGSKWFNNGLINKKVIKEEIEDFISNGWNLGKIKQDKFPTCKQEVDLKSVK